MNRADFEKHIKRIKVVFKEGIKYRRKRGGAFSSKYIEYTEFVGIMVSVSQDGEYYSVLPEWSALTYYLPTSDVERIDEV